MFALGSMLLVGASAKCEMNDIISLIAGGGDSDGSRRRLTDGLDGMFEGINQDCVPCITKCITDALLSGSIEDQGADYYMCFFACPEREYESPCSIEDMMNIQQTTETLFSDTEGLGALGGGLENFNPFSSAGLSQQCVGCQNKCLQETLVPALESLGDAIEDALSGGGDGGSGFDFEAEMANYSFCGSCCVGVNMQALLSPGAPAKDCKAEFQDTIPEMFLGSTGGSSGSDNTGVIVGVVVAVVVLIGLGAGAGYYCHTNKAEPDAEGPSTPMRSTGEGEEPTVAEV